MININSLSYLAFAVLLPQYGLAQAGGDFLQNIGKIYVVVGVILILFILVVIYLVRMDRRLDKLEKKQNEKRN